MSNHEHRRVCRRHFIRVVFALSSFKPRFPYSFQIIEQALSLFSDMSLMLDVADIQMHAWSPIKYDKYLR